MSSNCKNRNPLLRSGINQYQRTLQALLPASVQVDERDDADLILFAKKYAEQLKYYNINNEHIDGETWKEFMCMDVSVTLATILKAPVQACFAHSKTLFDALQNENTTSLPVLKKNFKALFDFGFTLTDQINKFYTELPLSHDYKEIIKGAIQSGLPEYYNRLKKYYNEAIAQNLIDGTSTDIPAPSPLEITFSQNFDETSLDIVWFEDIFPFTATYNGSSAKIKIKNIATHNLFTSVFDAYLKTLASITEAAGAELEKTLDNFPAHSPHYGLFLTFIKLFRYAQDHLNTFTQRHLDLYYKEILQLTNKNAEPDAVHLTFELQKNVENHLLAKDTVFKAGKDADGLEIFYALTDDVVLNQGKIAEIKNVYVKKDAEYGSKQIFLGEVANSEEGLGAKPESADGSWNTFGAETYAKAQTGFIIASNYLYLTEGQRTVTFTFNSTSSVSLNEDDIENILSLQFTGEKGWVDAEISSSNISVSGNAITIAVTIDGGADAIVPYSVKTHAGNYATELPLAKFIVNNGAAPEEFWNLLITGIQLAVSVTGMKNLALQNDDGIINPSKPFDLFGPAPHIGSSFIIGSNEIFNKAVNNGASVSGSLFITWDNFEDLDELITNKNSHTADILMLENATWKTLHNSKKLFNPLDETAKQSTITFSINELPGDIEYSENENYTVVSKYGFLKLNLNKDFGHGDYIDDLIAAAKSATYSQSTIPVTAQAMVTKKASKISNQALESIVNFSELTYTIQTNQVTKPYTPKVKEISMNYSASVTLDLTDAEKASFIHLTPFGSASVANADEISLLPSYTNEGELFIGIEDFSPDQTLSMLFQVAEGTADPLAEKQELYWYYLSKDNAWVQFEKEDIIDGTNDLTTSGIIQFSIPGNASAVTSLFANQHHWLRVTVANHTNAVCKLIAVTAQSAKAVLIDHKKEGNFFKANIPAKTISKLLVGDSSMKKIEQPFASFGGRTKETDEKFYVRVSERLRHKNRSIAIWDYERMVLEKFTDIYKVKCINHTQITEEDNSGVTSYVDNELKPGSVLIVPIPNLLNKNAFDPMRPNTSIGTLTDIRKYLYQYISPHVNLEVRNPRFEEIQMEFKIKYVTDDNAYYTQKLKEELEIYFAPWAYDAQSDIEFGGKIYKSVIIDFIEERSYVDYVSCVKMFRIVNGERSNDFDEIEATSARSVFVSVKTNEAENPHRISFIEDSNCTC
ncbi:MAG: baseplate J/gp47 family protein [Chitinophagales bacterium]